MESTIPPEDWALKHSGPPLLRLTGGNGVFGAGDLDEEGSSFTCGSAPVMLVIVEFWLKKRGWYPPEAE